MVSQDIPKALWTQWRLLRGRPCVENEVGMSWETTDVLSAAAADVLSADTTDVLPTFTTDILSADTAGLPSANTSFPKVKPDFSFWRDQTGSLSNGCGGRFTGKQK